MAKFGRDSEMARLLILSESSIRDITRTQSVFNGRKSEGIKVTIEDDGVDLVTYLPGKLVKSISDETFGKIKASEKNDLKYSVCYYGKMSKDVITEFYGRIHAPGEGRNEKLFNDLTKLMKKYGGHIESQKRKAEEGDEEASSMKISKQE